MTIKFGTSGWRAIIAEDFTFANVRRVTRAICEVLQEDALQREKVLIVGFDTRFLGRQFAAACVEEARGYGFKVLLCDEPAPTPALSHAIRHTKALGGINFTASHNPPQYNGIKFSTSDGAPALPEVTRRVEQILSAQDSGAEVKNHQGASSGTSESFNPRGDYLDDLKTKVRFDVIAKAGGRYAYDPVWGTGRGYLDAVLREHGIEVTTIHDWQDVLFGGHAPEPDSEHIGELREVVQKQNCALGLATDGDADRFGILDADGMFIYPNELIAVLFDYLAESRGWTGGVARSVATSHLVDRVARERGLKVYETPVGFKYIGELINDDAIILGGEESAGMSIKGHYPEKDGLLACLLAAEAVAARGASLGAQLDTIYARVGRVYSGRIGVRLTPEVAATLIEKLKREPEEFANRRVTNINRLDGVKFILEDESWILLRPSGTEPMVRIYAEASSHADLEVFLEQGRKYLLD